MAQVLRIHPNDTVIVALTPLTAGTVLSDWQVTLAADVPQGHKIALKAHAAAEAEIADLADAARVLCEQDGIDLDRIAIVGDGIGGAMALLLAGGRPGYVDAVVAIDPGWVRTRMGGARLRGTEGR